MYSEITDTRFICDAMLGRLTKYLRILGLDTLYIRTIKELNSYKTKDKNTYFFTKRKSQKIPFGNCVYLVSDSTIMQLSEIKSIIKPYIYKKNLMNRCVRCNTLLSSIEKDNVERRVPEFIFHKYSNFKTCLSCKRLYWQGSHIDHMMERVKEIISV